MTLILLVDDRAENRQLLGTFLLTAGYDVQEASTIAEAVARVRTGRPDVVVSDVLVEADG